jgi:hypothetical protein
MLMRVLVDNGTPRGVGAALTDHIVEEAAHHGWNTLRNGEQLDAAEAAGFDVFVTTLHRRPPPRRRPSRQPMVL